MTAVITPARRTPHPDAQPIVLLHGATSSWQAWESVLPDLESTYDVFAPTLPGHIGVPWADGTPVTFPGLVGQVEAWMDEQEMPTAHLVGNSLGGWLALELAARGRARSCLAFSPAGGWDRGETRIPKLFATMRSFAERTLPVADGVLAIPSARRKVFALNCEHGDRLSLDQAKAAFEATVACRIMPALLDGDVRTALPDLSSVTVPVTIAWSEHDQVIPYDAYAPRWREAAPHAHWLMLPGVGHVPMWDDPALVVRTIRESVGAAQASS